MAEQKYDNVEYVADSSTYTDTYDFYRRGLLEQQNVWIKEVVIPLLSENFRTKPTVRILSVGSGEGDIDIVFLEALLKDEAIQRDTDMCIEYTVVERNENFVERFKQRLKGKVAQFLNARFRFHINTLENLESELDGMKFDFIHFIHVLYYMDVENTLKKCMEVFLQNDGILLAVVQQEDNLYAKCWRRFSVDFRQHCGQFNLLCDADLATIAKKCNFKHSIKSGRRVLDISDIIAGDSPNPAGWKLLDFFFHSNNLQSVLTKEDLLTVMEFFRANSKCEDGKFLAVGDEAIALFFK